MKIWRLVTFIAFMIAIFPLLNCVSHHWCMAGHNAHGQLNEPYQRLSDLAIPILLVIGLIAWHFSRIPGRATFYWFLGCSLAFILDPFFLAIPYLGLLSCFLIAVIRSAQAKQTVLITQAPSASDNHRE